MVIIEMNINKAELIKLGTPKRKKTAEERVIEILKKKKKLSSSGLSELLGCGGGYFDRLTRTMVRSRKLKFRWCECGHTKFVELP